jgi:tetratricopeptide (TPR) repeat protein
MAAIVLFTGLCASPAYVAAQVASDSPAPQDGQTQQPKLSPRGTLQPPNGAGSPPPTPEIRAELLDGLYDELAKAPDASRAETIVAAIERLWSFSGSATTDLLVQRAIAAFASDQKALAQRLLDAVVELQPDYSEGFNRRAFVYYSQQDYSRALGDLRRVLALEPRHFRGLEGLARILRNMGEKKGAAEAYKELLKVHPHSPGASDALKELTREIEGQGI